MCINFNPDRSEFIEKYEELKSAKKMANYFNTYKKNILNFSKIINYIPPYKRKKPILTKEDKKEIIDNYYLSTASDLAKKYNCSKSSITKVWAENNLSGKTCRVYYSDFDYFETINSKDKAYFLGLIASDGCIFRRKGHQSLMTISLKENDRYILELFKNCLNSENPVSDSPKEMVSFAITSDKMCDDLEKYGLKERKTYGFKYKNIPFEYMNHFIRGYFDGDGSISITKNNYDNLSNYSIRITSNPDILKQFKKHLEELGIKIYLSKDNRVEKYTNGYQPYNLAITGTESKYNFINYIYGNCDNYKLSRKFDKCKIFLNKY